RLPRPRRRHDRRLRSRHPIREPRRGSLSNCNPTRRTSTVTSSPAFRSDVSVSLIDSMGGDQRLVQAARVSTKGAESVESAESAGRCMNRIRIRHAPPVAHTEMTVLVEAPIFVARRFMRDRIASYNEESGRYRTVRPSFYIPARERKLTQIGKVGEYRF